MSRTNLTRTEYRLSLSVQAFIFKMLATKLQCLSVAEKWSVHIFSHYFPSKMYTYKYSPTTLVQWRHSTLPQRWIGIFYWTMGVGGRVSTKDPIITSCNWENWTAPSPMLSCSTFVASASFVETKEDSALRQQNWSSFINKYPVEPGNNNNNNQQQTSNNKKRKSTTCPNLLLWISVFDWCAPSPPVSRSSRSGIMHRHVGWRATVARLLRFEPSGWNRTNTAVVGL